MSNRSKRKEEHLALAQMFFNKKKENYFDQVHILRPALPEQEINLNSIKTSMFGHDLSAPFFINAMTGGSQKSLIINKALGKIAHQEKIALALGSASILVKEKDQLDSFYVARENNPDGVIIANVNPSTPANKSKEIVDEIKADALQIHLNTVQELAMPEGDQNFKWLNNMKDIRESVDVPIIIKEVGFGLDKSSINKLKAAGFDYFDVAGSGGTNFAQIENSRNNSDVSYLEELGLPTPICVLMAKSVTDNLIVSGGVRNPLDIFKSLVLGGKFVGIANVFLQEYQATGIEGLYTLIHDWKKQLAGLLAIYGQNNLETMSNLDKYYDLPLKNLMDQLI